MKQLLIASALSLSLASASVLAGPGSTQGDLGQIFAGKVESTQIAELSHQEKQATEGEFWPIVGLLAAVALGVKGSTRGCGRRRC